MVERTRLNPASSSNANTSPSGRAPPIQLAQSLGSLTMDCESCFALTMSVIESRPPGLRTRNSSRMTLRLRKDRLMTPFEITTSTLASGSGMSSIRPSWHAIRTPEAAACAAAVRHIVGLRSTPITRPVGPTCHAAMMLSSPAPLPPPHEVQRCRSCAKFGSTCTIGQLDDVYEIDRYYPMAKPALTLHRLELFLAVLDEGGVGRAAKACHISQPAVSEHLQGLAAYFGVRLLERRGRSVRPTPAARLLEPYARQAVGLLRAAERAAADLQGLRSGALTVGASTTPGTYLLPAVLGRVHAGHPGIVLSLRISDTREIERWVSAGAGGGGGG